MSHVIATRLGAAALATAPLAARRGSAAAAAVRAAAVVAVAADAARQRQPVGEAVLDQRDELLLHDEDGRELA